MAEVLHHQEPALLFIGARAGGLEYSDAQTVVAVQVNALRKLVWLHWRTANQSLKRKENVAQEKPTAKEQTYLHGQGRTDPREGKHHQGDQGAITQAVRPDR